MLDKFPAQGWSALGGKPISISLSPNVQKDDVILALKLLFQPWKWRNPSTGSGSMANAIEKLEDEFKTYLGVKYAVSFNSGRSSMFAILKALDLEKDSDILIQAFTCNAVVNPILWAGLNPVYVDCANDFNADIGKLRLLIRENKQSVKILVAQHTFGLPTNMDEILRIARENGMMVIEDCAHALGAEWGGNPPSHEASARRGKVGTFGKAAFFSFSRDKVISCVYGGMAVTNNDEIGKKLEALQKEFGMPDLFWTRQQIMHPILLHFVILPLYNFLDLGKLFLIFSQFTHMLSKAVSCQEKRGEQPAYFPKALPNALAEMALNQFHKLEKFNAHRKQVAEFYYKELAPFDSAQGKGTKFGLPVKDNNIFLRFVVTHPKAHDIVYEAWHQQNILLGNWYTSPIDPIDTQLDKMQYISGSCPNAENLAQKTLNLPTHINISMDDAQRIVNFLKTWK